MKTSSVTLHCVVSFQLRLLPPLSEPEMSVSFSDYTAQQSRRYLSGESVENFIKDNLFPGQELNLGPLEYAAGIGLLWIQPRYQTRVITDILMMWNLLYLQNLIQNDQLTPHVAHGSRIRWSTWNGAGFRR
jgi:hypothetical protein